LIEAADLQFHRTSGSTLSTATPTAQTTTTSSGGASGQNQSG